jgi:hypothetical protein
MHILLQVAILVSDLLDLGLQVLDVAQVQLTIYHKLLIASFELP